MLDIKFVRQHMADIIAALEARGTAADIESFKKADKRRRELLLEIEELRHQRNVVSDRIAEMKKAGEDAQNLVAEMRAVSGRIKSLDASLSESEGIVNDIIMGIPNLPHTSVPVGKDEKDNPVDK